MAHKFVRNITGVRDINKQALVTNEQNDILSDDTHAYIRNGKKYHGLTDNIKKIVTSQGNLTPSPANNQVTLPNFLVRINNVPAGSDANAQIDGTNINVEGSTPFTIADAIKALQAVPQIVMEFTEEVTNGSVKDNIYHLWVKGDMTPRNLVVTYYSMASQTETAITPADLKATYQADIDVTRYELSNIQKSLTGRNNIAIILRESGNIKTLYQAYSLVPIGL